MYYSGHNKVVEEPIVSSNKFIPLMLRKGWDGKMEKIVDYRLDESAPLVTASSIKVYVFMKIK